MHVSETHHLHQVMFAPYVKVVTLACPPGNFVMLLLTLGSACICVKLFACTCLVLKGYYKLVVLNNACV